MFKKSYVLLTNEELNFMILIYFDVYISSFICMSVFMGGQVNIKITCFVQSIQYRVNIMGVYYQHVCIVYAVVVATKH